MAKSMKKISSLIYYLYLQNQAKKRLLDSFSAHQLNVVLLDLQFDSDTSVVTLVSTVKQNDDL